MIAKLRGTVEPYFGADPPPLGVRRLVVTAGGSGVGYLVTVSAITMEAITANVRDPSAPVTLLILTKVSETAIQLFGFATVEERQLFEQLTSVDNVGPSTALSLLAGIGNVDDIRAIIAAGDMKRLTTVRGVGKKTAEALIAELGEKFAEMEARPSDA
jgi:holliday junction DNA helicase RuvA